MFGDRAHLVDLNGDVGEGQGDDQQLVPLLTSVNIACGGHVGDAASMRATIALARQHGAHVGAHPSYPDRQNFGRRSMSLTDTEVMQCITEQLHALAEIAFAEGVRMRHVKPHGALYNVAARDRAVADAIARATALFDGSLVLLGLAGSELIAAGARAGLRTASEVFADRAYNSDGTLVSRDSPGAVLNDSRVIVPRAVRMVREGLVTTIDGRDVAVRAETICVHGDTPEAPALAAALHQGLTAAGIAIRPFA